MLNVNDTAPEFTLKNTAKEEGERILESAQAEILQESNKAKEELRAQV